MKSRWISIKLTAKNSSITVDPVFGTLVKNRVRLESLPTRKRVKSLEGTVGNVNGEFSSPGQLKTCKIRNFMGFLLQ